MDNNRRAQNLQAIDWEDRDLLEEIAELKRALECLNDDDEAEAASKCAIDKCIGAYGYDI